MDLGVLVADEPPQANMDMLVRAISNNTDLLIIMARFLSFGW